MKSQKVLAIKHHRSVTFQKKSSTIISYQNYTLALRASMRSSIHDTLKVLGKSVGGENAKVPRYEVKW